MGRLASLCVTNYRSIRGPEELTFPRNTPVVLIGENNAGKSNLVRALNLILGSTWPGTHDPDDNEFFGRQRADRIEIVATFDETDPFGGRYTELLWRYNESAGEGSDPVFFRGSPGPRGDYGFVRNDDRDTCMCICLEADRNLEYHLGYASKWTMLSRLMHRFHKSLGRDEATKTELETLFARVRTAFAAVPEFAAFTGTLQEQLGEMLTSMTHRLEVSFEAYNPANFFHALRLQAAEGSEPRTLAEMGTGEKQVLAMAFAYAYATAFHGGILLVIEEPEAHLHPLAQRWLAQRLRTMSTGGLQVVLTTHSPAFVNLAQLPGLALVRKEDGATTVKQCVASELAEYCGSLGATRAKADSILPFYAHHATPEILEGFFAKAIVLVEGPTESLALPLYLAKVGFHCEKEGVAVVPVGGKGNLAKWFRLFTCYDIPTYVIFDNDPNDDPRGAKRLDAHAALGLPAETAAAALGTTDLQIGATHAVFGANFETTMRALFPTYVSLEGAAKGEGVDPDSKPLIARRVGELLGPAEVTAEWQRVTELARAMRALLTRSASPDTPSVGLIAPAGATPAIEDDDDLPF